MEHIEGKAKVLLRMGAADAFYFAETTGPDMAGVEDTKNEVPLYAFPTATSPAGVVVFQSNTIVEL